ncbi:OB-fold protein [Bradyrhizobium sp. ORS 86]|uniref:OB-fold protein n=1 Tax=Bradyrhizobium sp. ORS 86 TaxID=1685970 RepID=UPI00388E7A16
MFASLFSIFAPPRFLGSNSRQKAIAAAFVACVILVFLRDEAEPTLVESKPMQAAVVGQSVAIPRSQPDRSSETSPQPLPSPMQERTTDLHRSFVRGEQVEVVRVSAMGLFREYDRNEVATDLRLKGKIVEINGKVAAINKDFFDNVYVELQTPNQFMSASVRPISSETDKMARLHKGQAATFRCETMGRFMGAPSGKGCVLMD